MTDNGIDRRYYELCALSEMKNALRSGDIWVQGSRQFKDFEDYLVPPAKFASLKQASELPLAVATDCDQYLNERLTLLETQLAAVNRMALANELPDAIITESGLKITPLDAAVPDTAQALINQTAMVLPHVKITELLLEVDEWTGFTRHFAHLKSGDLAKDKNLLLTTSAITCPPRCATTALLSASSDALATDSAVCAVTELDSSSAAASSSSAAAADSTRLDRSCAPPAISLLDWTTSELLDWTCTTVSRNPICILFNSCSSRVNSSWPLAWISWRNSPIEMLIMWRRKVFTPPSTDRWKQIPR